MNPCYLTVVVLVREVHAMLEDVREVRAMLEDVQEVRAMWEDVQFQHLRLESTMKKIFDEIQFF